jgi:hypothetical protein
MLRWLLMILVVANSPGQDQTVAVIPDGRTVAAPSILLRDLEWWGPNINGGYGWYPGQDFTPMPPVMGRIEDLRLTGIQEMVWEHAYHRIQAVHRADERTWFVGFALGTLKLTNLEHRRWQVEFTPLGGERPTRIFRTARPPFGSGDPP